MKSRLPGASARHALLAALVMAGAGGACAHGGHAGYDQTNEPMEGTTMTEAPATTIQGDGVRVEAAFDVRAGGPLQVRYRVHNTGDADLAVFDRGNRHAVMTRRQQTGEVGEPGFHEDGDGGLVLSHVARPLPQPSPTLPPTPLAARLAPGQALEGSFSFSPLVGEPPRRLRWCLGVAAFDGELFRDPEQVDGVEVWQASFALADSQQQVCTPWFDVAAGAFEAQ